MIKESRGDRIFKIVVVLHRRADRAAVPFAVPEYFVDIYVV